MKNGIIILVLAWFGLASVQAQTVSYPHELFDPLGIPQVEGAKLLHVDKKLSLVVYQATHQQVLDWIEQMDNLGFLHENRYKKIKNNIRRGAAYKGQSHIEYYFPVGTKGHKQLIHVSMGCNFVGDVSLFRYKKIPGSTIAIQLDTHSPDKIELDYQKGIFNSIGITDESGFIPKHTREIKTELIRTNKAIAPDLPEGTFINAGLTVKFVTGYIPTRADLDTWVKKLYKACAENASSIDPLLQGEDLAKVNDPNMFTSCTHYWTYTYNGMKYKCSITVNLDMRGQFRLWIMK